MIWNLYRYYFQVLFYSALLGLLIYNTDDKVVDLNLSIAYQWACDLLQPQVLPPSLADVHTRAQLVKEIDDPFIPRDRPFNFRYKREDDTPRQSLNFKQRVYS